MSETVTTDASPEGRPSLANSGGSFETGRSGSLQLIAGWLMVLGGPLGLLAAFALTVEKIELIKNPDYVPSCNFSPILACGSVMNSSQAEAFGFPNSLLGVVGFSVVTVVGALVVARVTLPEWVWGGLQLGVLFGVGLVHWLMFQSLERIGALCPYCMVVWTVTIPIAWFVTMRNLAVWSQGRRGGATVARSIVGSAGVLLAAWFVLALAVIFWRFQDYWLSLV